MLKRYTLMWIFLFCFSLVHAEGNKIITRDSICHYLDSFSQLTTNNEIQRAIDYGLSLKNIWENGSLQKDSLYCNLIEELSKQSFNINNIEESLSLLYELLPTKERVFGEYSVEFASFLSKFALTCYYAGDYKEAIRLGSEALKIQGKVIGKRHYDYAESLSNLAHYNSTLGNYVEAKCLCIEAMDIFKDLLGTNHPDYALHLNNLATYNCYLGDYPEAIHLEIEALEIQRKVLGPFHFDYMQSLGNLSYYKFLVGDYNEAIELGSEVLEIRKKVLGPEHPSYALALNNLALYNSALGKYAEAIRLGSEAIEIQKKTLSENHPDYLTTLGNLSLYYSALGNYTEAITIYTTIIEIQKKIYAKDHPDIARNLCNLAASYSNLGNYSEAVKLGTEAMEIYKKIYGPEHPNYSITINNLATYQYYLGNYPEAVKLGTEAMEIQKCIFGTDNADYARSLGNLANCYSSLGNYPEAIRLCYEASDIYLKLFGYNHIDYARILNNLASYNSSLGNYSEAIHLGTQAKEIYKKVLGVNHPDYATILNNLATYQSNLGNDSDAIKLWVEALEIQRINLGVNHTSYALSLENIANYCSNLGNFLDAINVGNEAVAIRKKIQGPEHPDYARSLNSLASFYSSTGNFKEAIRIGTEAVDIQKKVLGPEHPDVAISLSNLAFYNSLLGNHNEAYDLLMESFRTSKAYIINGFSGLSFNLQKYLWSSFLSFNINIYLPSTVFKHQTNESVSDLYNYTTLFAKGILLNTEIEKRRIILESMDTILVSKYDDLVANNCIYDKQLEKPISERTIDIDSLRSVIERQEMELARDSKPYGDFSRNFRITWQDVQESLDEDDIAVEFLDFPVYGTDSTMYVALTLRKSYDTPHLTPLFEKSQLDSVQEGSLYTDTSLYDLVWKPLESELSGVKAIYFSPSGELHRIGIEYVPITPTENICDRYNLHRLSSTRQLAVIRDGVEGEGGVLYGGLDYNVVTDKGPTVTEGGNGMRSYRYVPRANVDSLDLRGSLSYLPSTKEEVERIASNMKRNNVFCTNYIGKTGTEESFKQLDGTRPRILHIATHGFFMTEEEAKDKHFARPILQEGETSYREDKPMTRSGLLLSGCRPALNHETIPDGEEDGILTAQEISQLDLRGLDLVVLSACQTGLGDIVSGEGVFGLQRGFKNAGARTIVMSLWKVDDNATLDLMVSFYKHYLGGKTKEEAFRLAREELRRKSQPGEIRPDWAAFVMLDGE